MKLHQVAIEYVILVGWTLIAIVSVTIFPQGIYTVAFLTFGAVIAASLLIAWAAEASESSISRGLALAIVAIVQTIPEYFVEGTIAWKAGQVPNVWLANTVANFTGANRLLTGLGWPLILFTLMVQKSRKQVQVPSSIRLGEEQSIEVVFMLGSSGYYAWILLEKSITIIDSIVLAIVFLGYITILARLPRNEKDAEDPIEKAPRILAEIKSGNKKLLAISLLFLFGGVAFLLLSGPFVDSIAGLANTFLVGLLGGGAVFFTIQWIAPVLSEFPEKVTAVNWARQIKTAPLGLLNFISSAVNELTSLVALIPIVLFISSQGVLNAVPLNGQQWIEVFLTMCQSIYASTALFDLEYDLTNALVLFGLWILSTAVIQTRIVVGIIFLLFTVHELYRERGKISVFSSFRQTFLGIL